MFPGAGWLVVGGDYFHLDVGDIGHARDLVIMEIRLLHAPVLDRDLLPQRVPKAENNAAFDLRSDVSGLHRNSGIDRGPEITDLDLPGAAIDSDLRHACCGRAVLLNACNAQSAFWSLSVPGRHFSDGT